MNDFNVCYDKIIVITHCIFLKKVSMFVAILAICLKIGCWLSLFQKKNRTENLKTLFENNSINNSVTNGLNQKNVKKHKKQLYIIK